MRHKTNRIWQVTISFAALLLLVASAAAADYTIKAGSTDVTIYVTLAHPGDSSVSAGPQTGFAYNTPALKAYYVRSGGNAMPISLATQTTNGTWTSGGFVEMSAGNMPGVYRLDLPDAVCAAGVPYVLVQLYDDNNQQVFGQVSIELVAYDPMDSIRLGVAALPNAAAEASGGLITRGTSEGQLNINGGRADADVLRLNGDNQSLLDLKDFTDNGFDPSSNTVRAVDTAGYNNVLHVGAAQTYSTIAAAQTAAASGDLIVVHSGVYDEDDLGKNGVTYYFERGATVIDSTGIAALWSGKSTAYDYRVLGHGRFRLDDSATLFFTNNTGLGTNPKGNILIECDEIVSTNATMGPMVSEGGVNDGMQIKIVAHRQIRWAGSSLVYAANNDDGISIDRASVQLSSSYTECVALAEFAPSFGGTVDLQCPTTVITGTDAFVAASHVSTVSRLVFAGTALCFHGSANGLNAPSGTRLILAEGSVQTRLGRPAISGSGTIMISDAFAYDTATASATNVIKTPTQAMYSKLPSKDYLAGTSNATGDIELDDATGEAAANAVKWAGEATAATDVAIKDTLAKGTDITGFNDPTAAANASAVRTELTTELGRIDASVTSRASQTSVNALPTQTYFDDLFDGAPTFAEAMNGQGYTSARAEKLDNIAPSLLVSTAIDGTPISQTEFVLADGPSNDDALNGSLIVITDDSVPAEIKKAVGLVRDYDGDTHTVTLVVDPSGFTIADGNKVDVIATGSPAALWLGSNP